MGGLFCDRGEAEEHLEGYFGSDHTVLGYDDLELREVPPW